MFAQYKKNQVALESQNKMMEAARRKTNDGRIAKFRKMCGVESGEVNVCVDNETLKQLGVNSESLNRGHFEVMDVMRLSGNLHKVSVYLIE